MKIVTEEAAPVTKMRKAVPPHVAAAVATSLEKLPADRFATAKAFAEALANPAFTTPTMASAGASPRPRVHGSAITRALGATTVLLALALAWSLMRPAPPQPVTRYGLGLPVEQAVSQAGFAAMTPDGSRIFYSGQAEIPGLRRVWAKDRDRETAHPIPGTDGASAMAVSPDGERIAVVVLNEIRVTSAVGGGMVTVTGGVSGSAGTVAWLKDGSFVYVARDRYALERIPEGGGAVTTLWVSDSLFPQNVTPLPGAQGVTFQACLAPCASGDLYGIRFGMDTARMILRDARRGVVVDDILFYANTRPGGGNGPLYAIRFDAKTLTARGDPVLLADSVGTPGGLPYFDITASGSGLLMNGRSRESGLAELVWVDRAGVETPVDTSWQFFVTQFAADYGWALSPDDRQLVIGVNTSAGDDIWVKQLPRGPLSRVTFGASADRRPRWRPDGRRVTFLTDTSFALRRADGAGNDSVLWRGRADEGILSDDGRWILLRMGATSAASGGRDIFVMRVGEDTLPRPLIASPYDEMAMRLSPDARWLAYQSDETGRREVFVRPFPNVNDGKVQVSSDGGTGPLWSRDGRELFYLRRDEMMMAVPVDPGGTVRLDAQRELFRRSGPLAHLNAFYYTPWDITRDGRFIMTRSVDGGEPAAETLVVVENWLTEVRQRLEQ
jgi:eukaryotic-like serine/threonine-protein kinase